MKKIFKIFVTLFLVTVMAFGIAGCSSTQNELQSKINELQSKIDELQAQVKDFDDKLSEMDEQIRERDEKIERLEKRLEGVNFIPDGDLTEWQKIANKNSFIVSVNVTMLDKDLSAEDLSPINVTNIIPINGVFATNKSFKVSFYLVKTEDSREETLTLIRNFGFVDSVWRNEYDYHVKPIPLEEKEEIETKEHWEGFSGYIFVGIDRSYRDRLFTAEDFKIPGLVSVEWFNYKSFYDNTSNLLYYIEISSKTDTAVNDALEALYRMDFVKSLSPACDGKDGTTEQQG